MAGRAPARAAAGDAHRRRERGTDSAASSARPPDRTSINIQPTSQPASQPASALARAGAARFTLPLQSVDSSSLLALGRGRAVPLFVWGGRPEARMHVRSPEPARHGPAGARSFCVFGCTFWLCTFRARLRAFGSHTPLPLVAAQRHRRPLACVISRSSGTNQIQFRGRAAGALAHVRTAQPASRVAGTARTPTPTDGRARGRKRFDE